MAWSEERPGAVHRALSGVGRSWGFALAFGVLTILAGGLVLTWPGATVLAIALVIGLQLLVGGVYWFVRALSGDERNPAVQVLLAVLGVLGGIVVLRYPVLTAFALPLVLGLFWTVNGVMETFHAITRRTASRGWAIGAGALSIVAGVVLLAFPGIGLLTTAFLVGIWLVVYGAITAIHAVTEHSHAVGVAAPPAGAAHA